MTMESQTYNSSGASADDDAQAGPDRRRPDRWPTRQTSGWTAEAAAEGVAADRHRSRGRHRRVRRVPSARGIGKTELTRPGSGLADDTKPFNPKTVVYEIYGPPGTVATINYLDLDAQPQIARDVTLPWSLTLTTTAPAASANIVAQGDSDTIGCRVTRQRRTQGRRPRPG